MKTAAPVVITGCGAICGAGTTLDQIWNAIRTGASAVGPIAQWDAARWPVNVSAEVRGVDIRTLVSDRKLHKRISRTDMFGMNATEQALENSGLLPYRESLPEAERPGFNDRTGIFSGCGGSNFRANYDFFPALTAAGNDLARFGAGFTDSVNPMWLLKNLPNNVLCHVGIRYDFKGTNACITNQSVSGAMAFAEAAAALRNGEADRACATGHETPLEPENLLGYHRLGLLATEVVRPFDRNRNGLILGEGAAAVVMELPAAAAARGATVHGEWLGNGCVTESRGIVGCRPDGDGVARAVETALTQAGAKPEQVGLIVAHGEGTRECDAAEAAGLKRVFGAHLPPITAFKWATGQMGAASGALDVLLALCVLRDGIVPGIPTLNELDPALAPFPVSSQPQIPRSNVALCLSRGFGSMTVASLVRAPKA